MSEKKDKGKSMKNLRFSSKLRLISILTIAAILSISSLLFSYFSFTVLNKEETQEQEINAQVVNTAITDYLDTAMSNLKTMAIFVTPVMQADFDIQRGLLQQLRLSFSDVFKDLALVDVSGNELVRDSSDHTYMKSEMGNRLSDPIFQTALRGEPYIGNQTSTTAIAIPPTIPMAIPIFNDQDEMLGVLSAEISLKPIWEIFEKTKIDKTGYAYLVDSRGVLVAYRSVDQYMQLINRDLTSSPAVLFARTGGKGLLPASYQGLTGQKVLGVISPISSLGWYVIVESPLADLFGSMSNLLLVWGIVILVVGVLGVALNSLLSRPVLSPLNRLREGSIILGRGQLDYKIQVSSNDEVEEIANEFNTVAQKLRESYDALEERVAKRTLELEQHSSFLEAAAEVGRAATTFLDSEQLIRQIVNLIKERFGLYYVGLFLLDEESEWAVLKAGTGSAGQTMLRRGHRIKVGNGMIGWCVQTGKPRVSQDIDLEAQRLAVTELPNTRSEAALPLRSRGQVLGALTVQSEQPDSFNQDVVNVLQTMVDQVGVAIDNARLFAERQRAIDISRQAYGEISREAWNKLLHLRRSWGYRFSGNVILPARGEWRTEMVEALHSEEVVRLEEEGSSFLAVPLKVRGKVVGVFNLRKGQPGDIWTEEDIAMVQNLVDQVGQAIESARLFQISQDRAFHEQLVTEITSKMRQSLDVDTVLKTAASEIREVLGLEEVLITFGETNG